MERCLVASGDIDSFEKEATEAQDQERTRLRRRNAIETFEGFWSAGDREGALSALDAWLRQNTEDHEARALADERRSTLVDRGRFDARLDGTVLSVVGVLPCTVGREAGVIVRGAGVSREHCIVEASPEGLTLRDNGSRNGTTLRGIAMSGAVLLEDGAQFGLGPDLTLESDTFHGAHSLLVARGMDRGKRVVFVRDRWTTPLGTIEFRGGRAVFTPTGLVKLLGQRVVAPIVLARGDRIDGVDVAGSLEVLR
ncbi:MAG: FHA domain-containing protein [Myxococcales bacterium]|nr:FHA domain-containing protein [Myxococcales bacterium]